MSGLLTIQAECLGAFPEAQTRVVRHVRNVCGLSNIHPALKLLLVGFGIALFAAAESRNSIPPLITLDSGTLDGTGSGKPAIKCFSAFPSLPCRLVMVGGSRPSLWGVRPAVAFGPACPQCAADVVYYHTVFREIFAGATVQGCGGGCSLFFSGPSSHHDQVKRITLHSYFPFGEYLVNTLMTG